MAVGLVALVLVVGALVGMVGVGGVLLPPGLIALGGLSAHEATATSTWVFLFTGTVGTVAYARQGRVPWLMLLRLSAGVVPSAFAGAVLGATLPADIVMLALASLTLFVGVHQLLPRRDVPQPITLGATSLVMIGAVVGLGSAVTGTGGPVILVPVLLMLRVAPLLAVALSQAVQLPVVISGSVGYLQTGLVDVRLGTVLGLVCAVGTVGGALAARRVAAQALRQVVAGACLVAGALLLVRLLG